MDRLLVSETPPLFLRAVTNEWQQDPTVSGQNWRILTNSNNQYWVHEDVIDLEGYTMKDMTAYFRQSFEQRGGFYSAQWEIVVNPGTGQPDPLRPFDTGYIEMVIISTVPMNDANLSSAVLGAPGFVGINIATAPTFDYGNFNREMIIHGRFYLRGIDSVFGSDVFTSDGAAYNRVIQEYDFSSLEPTATDKLYVYRVLFLPTPVRETQSGLSQLNVPSVRILLDTNFAKEDDIPYLMRLKRGYELANQV